MSPSGCGRWARSSAWLAWPIADPSWARLVDESRAALGVTSPVRLLESDRVAVPVVYGLWRPMILVPAGTESWPAARRQAFLLHEMAHVHRRDCLVQTIASVARALYWPHPLAWWAQRRLRAEAERASDDRVVTAGMAGADYAHLLLEAARALGRAPQPVAVVAVVERSSLEDRLVALLDPAVPRGVLGSRWKVVAPPVAASLVALLAAVQLVPLPVLAQAPSLPAPEPAPRPVEAPAAAPAPPKAAAAAPAPAARPAPSEPVLEGTVTDARGKPVDDALVLVADETERPRGASALVALTDRNGRFRVVVPAGTALYRVKVERSDWAPGYVRFAKPGTAVSVTLEPGGAIEGRVLDKETRKPVAGARIDVGPAEDRVRFRVSDSTLAGAPRVGRVESDADGRFRLGSLAAGQQELSASASGYQRARWVAVTGERDVELLLMSAPAGGDVGAAGAGTSMTAAAAEAAAASRPPRRSELDPEQRAQLEKHLAERPDDLEAREQLLNHYMLDRTPEGRAIRARHALWVVENAPESDLAGRPYTSFNKTLEPEPYQQAQALWLRHVEAHAKNPKVLSNAARFFTLGERSRAEQLLGQAAALEPENDRWRQQLGHTFMLSARGRRNDPPDGLKAKQALEQFEAALRLTDNDSGRASLLANAAECALWAGDDGKAKDYARQIVDLATAGQGKWDHGNAIHEGHRMLGHVALNAGDVAAAKGHLLEAGKTPGSPQLNSFGPELTLARDLLAKGERDAVIEYLQGLPRFWQGREQAIEEWVTLIKAGQTPELDRFRARRTGR
jgi:hypothetical protein